MIRSRKVEALVLERRSVGEADRRVTILARTHGLLRVTAKGVRRIPSRRGGHLEPVSKVLTLIAGRSHAYVAAVETIDSYMRLHAEPATARQAAVLASVAAALVTEEEACDGLFLALDRAWQLLPRLNTHQRLAVEAAVLLATLNAAGVQPALERCYRCGTAKPRDAIILAARSGGWHCLSCHSTLAGTEHSVPPELLPAIRWLARRTAAAPQLRWTAAHALQVVNALREYVSVVIERPLPRLVLTSSPLVYAR